MSTPHTLHQLLETTASIHPDRPAVVDGTRVATYAELDARSNQLAHLLRQLGVRPGHRVGLYLDKSLEAVSAIYGILKAGAAYVPLDARAPVSRIAYITRDCGISHLVSGQRQSQHWQDLVTDPTSLKVVVVKENDDGPFERPYGVETFSATQIGDFPNTPVGLQVIDQDLAYILYTSGSTGSPKGVMLSHRNGLAFVDWAISELRVGSEDRLSSHAPFHFDLSIFDLFAASGSGASVALMPSATSVFPVEVARFIDAQAITIWYSVPSILSSLTQHGNLAVGDLPTLRAIVFAGEVFPSKYLARLMRLLPHASFHNWYGPTETNVCTAYRVTEPPDVHAGDIPIGRAISNVETFVLAANNRRAAIGQEGELVVRGATVMAGYWGDPEKTASRLVTNPLAEGLADNVYHTGDLVIEDEEGNYRFLGRRDHQIKSRGYRIELGEIETALNSHPEVVECAVIAVPDEMISNRIKAHLVVAGNLNAADLVSWCAERVPRYMIPEAFEFVEMLPKTSTGKIDRQALLQVS